MGVWGQAETFSNWEVIVQSQRHKRLHSVFKEEKEVCHGWSKCVRDEIKDRLGCSIRAFSATLRSFRPHAAHN